MNDEGIRAQNQMRGITDKGNLRNLRTDEKGRMLVVISDGKVENISKEKVLTSVSATIGTEATTTAINGNATTMLVANYSETADITIGFDDEEVIVGASVALEIPVNKQVSNLSIKSSEEDTKVYYLLKGIEQE